LKTIMLIMLLVPALVAPREIRAGDAPSGVKKAKEIVGKMAAAYAGIESYRTDTEVQEYRNGRLAETQRFLYTFRKPDHIRLDMKSPHPGLILVYPNKQGKATVKPGGWGGFLRFNLSLDSGFLKNSTGQRLNETDFGLLIRNIRHSITDGRQGDVKIAMENGLILVQVLADDHFRSGSKTRYRFFVDSQLWLPAEVEEFTPDGIIKRRVIFRNVRTSIPASEDIFRIE